jgi:hypothetical protein
MVNCFLLYRLVLGLLQQTSCTRQCNQKQPIKYSTGQGGHAYSAVWLLKRLRFKHLEKTLSKMNNENEAIDGSSCEHAAE